MTITYDQFCAEIAAVFGEADQVIGTSNFEELGWDSLQLAELDLLLERLGRRVSERDLLSARSPLDLYEAFCRSLAE